MKKGTSTDPKIAIVGAGSQGLTYGGWLTLAGFNVWFITRTKKQAKILNKEGLVLEGVKKRTIKTVATANPRKVGKVDLICIFTKAYDTKEAAKSARFLLGPRTIILTLQGGLGNVETLSKILGGKNVIAGVSYAGTKRVKQNRVKTGGVTKTVIGELDGKITKRLKWVAKIFNQAKIETQTRGDIQTVIWDKLLIMAGQNALCAITGLTFGQMRESYFVRKIIKRVLSEIEAVAAAQKIKFSFTDSIQRLKDNWASIPQHKASTRQDLEAGRKTEIDAVNGEIVRLGKKLGIPTPYNEFLVLLVKTLEESGVVKESSRMQN